MKKTPLQLIKAACLEGGSSFEEDRKPLPIKGSTHNVPIPINPECNIFAFPTQSPSAFQCNWIFYNHVKSIKPSETRTEVTSKSIILLRNLFRPNVFHSSARPPRVRAITFFSCNCYIYCMGFGQYWTLSCLADSSVPIQPYI